jgi:hypothetical protein
MKLTLSMGCGTEIPDDPSVVDLAAPLLELYPKNTLTKI